MPDRRFASPARFFLLYLYDLFHEGTHGLGRLVLLLPRGVGVGADGEDWNEDFCGSIHKFIVLKRIYKLFVKCFLFFCKFYLDICVFSV